MLTTLVEGRPEATITLTQTTYLHLQVDDVAYRVDFLDKVEFRLKPGVRGVLAHHTRHPLLLDYSEPQATVYLTSRPQDPPALLRDLHRAVDSASHHWRELPRYLFGWSTANALASLEKNLTDGSGLVVERAPASIVRAVVGACDQHGAATYLWGTLEAPAPANPYSVLFIGSCYVVARNFQVRAVKKTGE
ncbi:hypothetical protein [Hymenobacter sp. BT491]|uniref:hypothetical protein n=1 Tax=Hymenobacter sp. BT491 TaxID=2766779 RepID=UPI001653686C|nr:hypothetical protein [Hymenobacter sp. BT491]MBC6989876.1 hypothetical protein [Hymenobacter sp. BT491]